MTPTILNPSDAQQTSVVDIPRALGKYEVQALLGRGGMGVVYRAYDSDIDRSVAIKVVHADLVAAVGGDDILQRFRQEARAAARCVHRNIVAVFDYGVSALGPFMVMEYVEGLDLKAFLKADRPLPLHQRVDIVLQVLAALEYAHKQGVVHRDIKPANILLLDTGLVKVTDFGVAKIDASDLTQIGDMIGTPTYMSPEARLGAPVDGRADLYAIGVVLLELICGNRPDPQHLAPQDIVASLQGVGLSEREWTGFERLLTKALDPLPAKRHQTAAELAAALESVVCPDSVYRPATDELAATVIDTRRRSAASSGGAAAPASLATTSQFTPAPEVTTLLNESLARYLGPVSSRVVRFTAAKSSGLNDLIDQLARQIPSAEERTAFLTSVEAQGVRSWGGLAGMGASGLAAEATGTAANRNVGAPAQSALSGGVGHSFSKEELAQVTEQLAVHMGPLAPHLVRRAAKKAVHVRQLYQLLAEKISDQSERETFLARCRW